MKLDIAKLRLSRWADAVDESRNQHQVATRTPADARKVEALLGEIVACFADAERVSQRFQSNHDNASELQVFEAGTDLELSLRTMHDKMRDLALRRQRRSTVRQKAAWALYERKHFDRLLSDVGELIEGLVQLFPATQQRQSELVVEEVQELEAQPAFAEVEAAADGVDDLLTSSIQQALAAQGSHSFANNTVTDEADAQYGDQHAQGAQGTGPGHTYSGNMASKKAKAHYGNRYL